MFASTVAGSPPRRALPIVAPAVSDWILLVYFGALLVGLARAAPGAERDAQLGFVAAVTAAFAGAVLGFRLGLDGRLRGGRTPRALVVAYRLLAIPTILLVYLRLRPILPLLNQANYDAALYRLDVRLLGFEPTLALEPYLGRAIVEWFSFFYYSYFFFMAAFAIPIALFERNERRAQYFAATFLLVVCTGQLVYALVPGFGPYQHLATAYQRPLQGGFFYDVVIRAVAAGGPLRDIFPSLHTAVPTTLTLFAWRHYRRFAVPATFWTMNIVAATIVLRWHWAVDVLAGLVLAVAATLLAPMAVEAWQRARARFGMAPNAYW